MNASSYQQGASGAQVFAAGTWGGECPLDCHDDGVDRGVRLIAVR